MKKISNGFQCEKCKTIYSNAEKAKVCEDKLVELPLIEIGTILDDSYGEAEFRVKVTSIYFEGHMVCYRFEMEDERRNWSDCFSYYGNEELLERFDDQIKLPE